MEIKCQLDATEVFIADPIACSTCFGHHYAHHQELKSIIQWLLMPTRCNRGFIAYLIACSTCFGHHYAHHQELKSMIQWLLMPTRCNRGFYCRAYCLLNVFRAPLCPSSGAQEYYTVVAACDISCCGFQVAGLVWS